MPSMRPQGSRRHSGCCRPTDRTVCKDPRDMRWGGACAHPGGKGGRGFSVPRSAHLPHASLVDLSHGVAIEAAAGVHHGLDLVAARHILVDLEADVARRPKRSRVRLQPRVIAPLMLPCPRFSQAMQCKVRKHSAGNDGSGFESFNFDASENTAPAHQCSQNCACFEKEINMACTCLVSVGPYDFNCNMIYHRSMSQLDFSVGKREPTARGHKLHERGGGMLADTAGLSGADVIDRLIQLMRTRSPAINKSNDQWIVKSPTDSPCH